jgi:hypothetical protein
VPGDYEKELATHEEKKIVLIQTVQFYHHIPITPIDMDIQQQIASFRFTLLIFFDDVSCGVMEKM